MPSPTCPVCGAAPMMKVVPDPALEGFILGVVCQRMADLQGVSLVSFLCSEHLAEIRHLANLIPPDIIPPHLRPTLLNFGLSSVA